MESGEQMSDGCKEKKRMSYSGCPDYWTCERAAESREALQEVKLFEREHEGQRFRKNYGKSKRKSAARLKVKR